MSSQTEAQRLIAEIQQIKAQAEEHLKAAETSRQKADSEALFAFNAKNTCEAHSTAIAGLKGTVEADVNAIATKKQNSDDLVAALTTGKATVDAETKAIGERRKEIDQLASRISDGATTSQTDLQKIKESKDSIDALRKEAEESRDATIAARDKTSAERARVEQFSTESNDLAKKITTAHESSIALRGELTEILTAAETDKESLAYIIAHLTKSDEVATNHEARLGALSKKLDELTKQATDLLPGATSAGLASAFATQKRRFDAPQKRWLRTFVGCIIGLAVISLPSFLNAIVGKNLLGGTFDPTWDGTLRGLTLRLPLVIPLVWLAIYAARNYMLSLRLEEDYAYKEALSTAFEGYRRQMEQITASETGAPAPLTTLCVNVLSAMAERPGRIYEGGSRDITLVNEAHGAIGQAVDLSKRQLASR
ncbi:MAG: hypothetical protein QOF24_2363 [Verrucomicrobiota bacterium]|jgi:hypothetical protein